MLTQFPQGALRHHHPIYRTSHWILRLTFEQKFFHHLGPWKLMRLVGPA